MAEENLELLKSRLPRVWQAYLGMLQVVEGDAPLNAKARQLVLVAVAAALGQREPLAYHRDLARKAGASDAEIEHAIALAIPLAGLVPIASATAVTPAAAGPGALPEAPAPPPPKKTTIEEGDWVVIRSGQGGLFVKAGKRGQVTKIAKGRNSGIVMYYVKCADVAQEEKFTREDLDLASPDGSAPAPAAPTKTAIQVGDWVLVTRSGLLLKGGERGQVAKIEPGPLNTTFYHLRKPGLDAEEKFLRSDFEPEPGA